jgi:hypothetical protein
MSLNDLANIGQVIGAIAVVISLFYVAHQIRQNTNAVRSDTAQTVHEHFANWYHVVAADDELSQIIPKGLRDYGSLSEKEKVRLVAACMSFLSYSQNAFSEMARGVTSAAAVARLGACHYEPRVRARWQSVLERAVLPVWR